MSIEEIDDENFSLYERNQARVFFEQAINRCLDVFDLEEVMRMLEDQLDMIEETSILERKSRDRTNITRFIKGKYIPPEEA